MRELFTNFEGKHLSHFVIHDTRTAKRAFSRSSTIVVCESLLQCECKGACAGWKVSIKLVDMNNASDTEGIRNLLLETR